MPASRSWWITLVLVAGLAGAAPAPVLAVGEEPSTSSRLAERELEDLLSTPVETITTASKREQRASSAPASVTVISSAEIEAFGWRTLAEVLDAVRGLYTSQDRNYAYAGVRGFSRADYNTRILLLLDGHTLNDDVYDMAFLGTELPLDLGLVERVEIVRGPGSALYGGNALFAVVNVITRRATRAAGTEVAAGLASGGAVRGRVTHGIVRDEGEALVSLSASGAAGGDHFYPEYVGQGSRGDGISRGDDWDRFARGFAKITWGAATLQVAGGARAKGVPTGSFGAIYDDPRNATFDQRWFAELRWERAAPAGAGWAVRAWYDEYLYHQRYAYETGDPSAPTSVNRDELAGRWVGSEARASFRPGPRANVLAGVEAELHLQQDQRNRDEGGPTFMDARHASQVGAAYLSAEVRPLDRLELVGGLRYDHYSTFGGAVSPRAGAVLRAGDGTVLKALYGRAFRPPAMAELHYESPLYLPADDLVAEWVDTWEAVLEQALGPRARLTVAAYRYRARDLIGERTDPATGLLRTANVDSARALGAEAELEVRWAPAAATRLSWSVQRAEDLSSGVALSNSPANLGKLHVRAPLAGPLRGALEVLWMSARRSAAGARVPGHARANATLVARGLARGRLDLSLGVQNLLDADGSDPGRDEHLQAVLPRDGRTFRADAALRF